MPGWLGALVVGSTFVGLVLLELRRPLRARRSEPKLRRNARNLAVGATSAIALQLLDSPVMRPLAQLVERRRWGLVKWLGVPPWLEATLALVLLDYTLYLWHVALHRVPCLWRAHQVHHVDLDMDASTALRFHGAEIVTGLPVRAAQVAAIGVSPGVLSIWGVWLLCEVLFHHANLELPYAVERWLCRVLVTPRMHGIHHSIVPEELHSNWSSGLTLWDTLHGTLRLAVPQDEITIGVAAYRDPGQVELPRLLAMPFERDVRDPSRLPGGDVPRRAAAPGCGPTQLLP